MIPTYKIVIFVLATLGILYVSRASLLRPRSHGFFRFFAWEVMLLLFLLNVEKWFFTPLAWNQIVSWILLLVALGLVIHGVWLLQQIGVQDARRNDSPMLAFEKTTRLVTIGAYRYIRHPLYSSLLILTWGIYFKDPGWLALLLAALTTAFLFATAWAEESEDIKFFGAEYRDYMKKSKMFIPFII
jgi:protein-S-isoprenylcysteine O-methyltransferase Ste14